MLGGAVLSVGLRLEPWTPAERDVWRRLNNDVRVVRYMGDGQVDPEETERLFDKILALNAEPDPRFLGLWAVWEGAAPVGMAELKYTEHTAAGEVELIYALLPEVQGRGLGAALLDALLEVARGLELSALATVHPDNAPSLRVLERAGFTRAEPLEDGTLVLRWAAP